MMTRRTAMAELYSALVILSITISMSYVVYSELRAPRTGDQATFLNRTTLLAGAPELLYLQVNSSKATTLISAQVDNLSTTSGVLALRGGGYVISAQPCESGSVTFYSVYAPISAQLSLQSDGVNWIAGSWRDAGVVPAGWSEVMMSDASTCSVSIPGGSVSPLPLTAANATTHFTLFLPVASGTHSLLLIFAGGYDRVEFST